LPPRPACLDGLRLGLVENTKVNSSEILEKLADRLTARYGTTVTVRNRKRSPSHEIDEAAVKALHAGADLVISGIGD
jgi:predicted ribosome-associated RNA-binding protein Tma20